MKKKSFIARSAAILLGITLGFGTLPVGAFKSKPLKAAEVTDITGSTTVETVGDINGDGEINAKDVTILRRYLAKGWGVELPEKANKSFLSNVNDWWVEDEVYHLVISTYGLS